MIFDGESKNVETMAKCTTVTLVEIPFQNTLKVREVVQNSLIWYDEKEKELPKVPKMKKKKSESDGDNSDEDEDSDDSDDLLDEGDDSKSPHDFYKDVVSAQIKQLFDTEQKLVPVKFIANKADALKLIKSSVKTTLVLSGRAGIGLLDSLYEHGLTPMSTISNVVVIC